jgi:hypothetical protein
MIIVFAFRNLVACNRLLQSVRGREKQISHEAQSFSPPYNHQCTAIAFYNNFYGEGKHKDVAINRLVVDR